MFTPLDRAVWRLQRLLPSILQPAARYPADPRAFFVLALSVFSGATALTLDAAPATLEALLPKWGVFVWGAVLAMGSLLTLVGMAFQSVNGIVAEQIGSVAVGAAAIFYSVLAVVYVGPGAVQVVGIIFAWGLSCLARWAQLQMLMISAYHEQIARAEADDRRG